METQTSSLKEKWEVLKQLKPQLRIRNAADELNVTEVELLALNCGENVTRLNPEFTAILAEVEALGKVMALTRNDDVVHERKGVYLNPSFENPHVGLFVGEDIDLRIFFASWGSAFAVVENAEEKPRKSLQFFAKDGEAIHKIYLTPLSNDAVFDQIVEKYKSDDQSSIIITEPKAALTAEKADSEIDVASFQEGWRNLTDTHHFFGLLKKNGLTRTQALRLAPEGNYAVKVSNNALREVVTEAAKRATPIMVFVGNPGIIQIHTGPVKKLMDHGDWFNVLDPDFNLHVKESSIADSWIVRKPSEDGTVTALECFDKKGNQIAQLFGKRKPGIPELEEWRAIVQEVENKLKLNN